VLGVSKKLIEEYSVVSAEVAKAMALDVKTLLKTDFAIATTGNAGPSKGEADADVGTVFIALATPNEVLVEMFNFGQPREKVIDRASVKGLEMLLKEISKKEQ
jgi:nicotinamide-nucleotide amidase